MEMSGNSKRSKVTSPDVTRRELLAFTALTGGVLVGGQLIPGGISATSAQGVGAPPAPLDVVLRINGTEHRLRLDPRNPRLHSDRQIKQIAGSIKAFGFNVPVLADQDGNVLAGHGRVHAAQRLGLREIPVIRLQHLTRGQARAFSVADNRLSETASWDVQLFGSKPGTAAHDWRRSLGRPTGGAE